MVALHHPVGGKSPMLSVWRKYGGHFIKSAVPNHLNHSIELVLIKLAYETNHQRFDQNTLAFITLMKPDEG